MPERPGPEKDDQFGDRAPTSHERMAGQSWDASYQDGPAPWDIGGPQPAVERLVTARGFTGAVLDVGCGTGAPGWLATMTRVPVGASQPAVDHTGRHG